MDATTLSRTSALQHKIQTWVEAPIFVNTILALIVINAIILGLETSPGIMAEWGNLITALNSVLLAIFVVELLLRMFAWR